ncbi:MAG TPA: sensor histidine kinase [Thermoleophilaceae bacterium]|nr:sensor histidine kinase [Thermoleophilaceae bacterium]
MLETPVILVVSFAYLGLLFAIAYWGDKRAAAGRSIIARPSIYALSLAVYATSWTFYGSVGRAASTGVGFLPIYLGPTLMFALGWLVLRKIIRISKENRITSIADFVASRYGKSTLLGGLVAVIAVVGIVPYISLQLKVISNTFSILREYPEIVSPSELGSPSLFADTGLYVALVLAAFTIAFGTRKLDATERHEGMVAAIAFESVVKLVAFVCVGLFVTFGVFGGFGDLFGRAAALPQADELFTLGGPDTGYMNFMWLTVLSMLAIVLLPRQFQVAVVENVDERHVSKAIWLFPLYLLAINVFVLPIALGGLVSFQGAGVDADTFVLALPMAEGQQGLALFAYLGGLSAATGMLIVETIALSTMVSNNLVMPALLRAKASRVTERRDLRRLILGIRRAAIVVVLLLGYAYFRAAGEATALVSIGLVSFAAVAQFAPAVLGGIFWKGGSKSGALVGLSAGFLLWAYTMLLPSFARSGWLPESFLEDGPLGVEALRPEQLFGLAGLDGVSHAMFWSMLVNVGCYVGVSLFSRRSAAEHGQAALFVDVFRQPGEGSRFWRGTASVADLELLLARFLGPRRASEALAEFARGRGLVWSEAAEADAEVVHHVERLLAGSIGAASARVMVASVVQEEPLGIEEVMDILDETSEVIAYSRELERKSQDLEAATAELRAANRRLKEVDRLKDDFVSTVTHELRTPLTSMRAFSEILLDNPELETSERERFLRIVIEEIERLTRLINQVLDLSKIESGRADWQIAEVDLREVIEDCAAATAQLFADCEAELDVWLPETAPPVAADRDRVKQVMLNLLSNAAKFCAPGRGRVAVELRVDGGALRVDVRDNGPGIRPQDQQAIFEKFRQGGDGLTERPQGTGLGLPISHQIVTHLGGELWVESAPGSGATFSFTLPLAGSPVGTTEGKG